MFKTIISAEQLQKNLNKDNWLIVDTRFDLMKPAAGYDAYHAGHIPNAVYTNLNTDLSSEVTALSGRHPLPKLHQFISLLNQWGLNKDTQVVVYDDANASMSARLWWLLKTIGHQPVAVLDGGLKAWLKNNYPLSQEIPLPQPSNLIINTPDVFKDSILTTAMIQKNISTQEYTVLDARAPERYRGEQEPIDPQKGHVPNALNFPLSRNLDEQGHFLPADELRVRYQSIIKNARPDKIACMCGSGVTACHTILAMTIANMEGAKLYAGSWSEWIRDPNRPIVTGG